MAAICGLPAASIEQMARQYAEAEAAFIRLGNGLTRYANGAMTVRDNYLPAGPYRCMEAFGRRPVRRHVHRSGIRPAEDYPRRFHAAADADY